LSFVLWSLDLVVDVITGMLGFDRLADRRPHQVEVLVAGARNVKVAAILEVFFDGGDDLVRREA
jgi:hypothetical protein